MEVKPSVTYSFGPYVLDRSEWRLCRGEDVVDLPPKAFAVLLFLVERAGTLVLKDEILSAIWKDTFVEEGNVAFYVAALRRALADPPGATYIETVKTRGYRFVVPVVTSGSEALEVKPANPVLPSSPEAPAVESQSTPRFRIRPRFWALIAVAFAAVLVFAWLALSRNRETIGSIVVVPFLAIAPAADQAYLESGLAEAIAMRLSAMTALRVPPLAAVRQNEDPFEAGRRLGTRAVLTGTVQKTADRLLVSAQLTSVSEGKQLGSWSFDTTPGEILKVEKEIAERIAVRVGTDLTEADRGRFASRDTPSGEAYDLFLQAREQWKVRTPHSLKRAIELYEKAINIDPKFARAYAGLADCYNLTMSGLSAEVRYPLARKNAEKAVALDPESVEGHTSLAFIRYKFEWRWRDADAEFKRAIALNPQYALAHHWYGEFVGLMGRQDEAIAELKRARELDPQSLAIIVDLTLPLEREKRLAEARAVLDSGLQIDPNWPAFHIRMSEILKMEGRERESAESLWRSMILRGVPTGEIDELRAGFAKGGTQGMIRAQIRQYLSQEIKPTSPASFIIATNLSFLYGRLGERDEAFRWLEKAIVRREDAVIHLLTNPAYDSLRNDPRFDAILKRLELKESS
jgi:DNA-binding winged helix-turn-helix (wHTH) protein/tetratricopeptide (TPR) repeat protein/TolB-like protein